MVKRFLCLLVMAAFCLAGATELMAQVASTGQLLGTVTDQTGAVIAGATVKVKDDATGAVIETRTSAEGHFSVASLRPGSYTVTVTMTGFKAAEYRAVKIIVGQVYDLGAKLEVGALESTVVVEAGAEVLETVSTTIGTTITGKSITQLPLTSRDALDLAVLMPGASTTGRARQTSFMGLPKGAINITMDGINVQDNVLKSNDGFFTTIRPRIDSMEEFSISTAGQGAEQSAEGAVQIRFETKRGSNVYHGGGWWYHRNDFFNSNYWFSNRDGVARQRQRLNQFGGNVGGPVWKDKIFFFVAMDNYRNPSSQFRSRTIYSTNSVLGLFDYVPCTPGSTGCTFTFSANPNAWTTCVTASSRNPNGGMLCTADLLALGAANGLVNNAFDTASMNILNAVSSARTAAGVKQGSITTPWLDTISFNNPGDATRRFPDVRLDWNITKNIAWKGIYHYQYFGATPDFLNGADQTYPVAPFNTNQGSQISNRNEWVTGLRWTIGTNKSNDFTAGLITAPISFYPDLDLNLYPSATTNLGTVNIRRTFPTISSPILGYSTQGRNGALIQLVDTFSWSRGTHTMMFGGSWTRIRKLGYFASTRVNTASVGSLGSDPASSVMTTASNFPGASSTDRTNASSLYAALTGRISGFSGSVAVNPGTRAYTAGDVIVQNLRQNEFGVYGSDSWRMNSELTLNYGLRWEFQGVPWDIDNISFNVQGGGAAAFGVSGTNFVNGLFKPGTLSGTLPTFVLQGSKPWYNNDLNNFAPNVGLAWSPTFENKLLKSMFGEAGKTVFRASYSVVFTREGTNNFEAMAFSNPGITAAISVSNIAPTAGCATPVNPGQYVAGCLTLSSVLAGNLTTLLTVPTTFPGTTPSPIRSLQSGQYVNVFDNNLRTPLVHNWSAGIQREITPGMVLEVRYVGNHGSGLWRQIDVNEINIIENGFLTEFNNAKINLAANGGTTFAPGGAGTVPLPIMTQLFTGLTASNGFANGTLITALNNNAPGSFASSVAFSTTYLCNLVGSAALPGASCPSTSPVGPTAFPVNFWTANPHDGNNGSYLMTNMTHSTYNGLTVEVRKRYSKGLQFSGNYTFAKALTNYFGDSSSSYSGFTTLRNLGFDKGPSPWDLRHTYKFNWIYSFPFGPGRKWTSSHAWVNRIIEGWEVSGVWRWQSGRVFQLTSGNSFRTLNQNDAGVRLIGITPKQIQDSLGIRKLPTGQVYYFPASLISSTGTSNTAAIAPCNTPGLLCRKVWLYGPSFFRTDINVVKKFKIFERYELEYRAEFLNAFNNINFFFPGSETTSVATTSITGSTFGQVTNAFRDVSTTDDNGGRIIQMVIRVRF